MAGYRMGDLQTGVFYMFPTALRNALAACSWASIHVVHRQLAHATG